MRHSKIALQLFGLLAHSFQLADDSRVCPVEVTATAVSTPTDDVGGQGRPRPSSSLEGMHKVATSCGCSPW